MSSTPTVRIEIYEADAADDGGFVPHGVESGVYAEVLAVGEMEHIERGVRAIVPKLGTGEVRSVKERPVHDYQLQINVGNRQFVEAADSVIWKRSVTGVLRRHLEERHGFHVRVPPIRGKVGTFGKRPRDGWEPNKPLEISGEIIRGILGLVYVLGNEDTNIVVWEN